MNISQILRETLALAVRLRSVLYIEHLAQGICSKFFAKIYFVTHITLDMRSPLPVRVILNPKMVEIVDRLRGKMSAQEFIFLLLKIADSPGSVAPTPEMGTGVLKGWKLSSKATPRRRTKGYTASVAKAP